MLTKARGVGASSRDVHIGVAKSLACKNDRWICFPDPPYSVSLAFTILILQGEELFGILTLLNFKLDYFDIDTSNIR